MARLCGGAHEISGIPAPLCLCGWVMLGRRGGVGYCVVGDGVVYSDRWWVGVLLKWADMGW